MRPLDIDFVAPPRADLLGWCLLLAGLSAPALLFAVQQEWAGQSRELLAMAEALEARLPRPAAAKPDGKDAEALAAARRALEKSRLPWGNLFKALEAADSRDVALLSVTPDGARGQLKIHAEARDLGAMLAYHRRLEQDTVLRQVTLVDHESGEAPGAAPVRFHISAAWGPDRGHP